eukprot:2278894-Rhodomonas_salina.5
MPAFDVMHHRVDILLTLPQYRTSRRTSVGSYAIPVPHVAWRFSQPFSVQYTARHRTRLIRHFSSSSVLPHMA